MNMWPILQRNNRNLHTRTACLSNSSTIALNPTTWDAVETAVEINLPWPKWRWEEMNKPSQLSIPFKSIRDSHSSSKWDGSRPPCSNQSQTKQGIPYDTTTNAKEGGKTKQNVPPGLLRLHSTVCSKWAENARPSLNPRDEAEFEFTMSSLVRNLMSLSAQIRHSPPSLLIAWNRVVVCCQQRCE